jgi:ribosome-associated toxin RatA of RatAB toxin-antitoxin module
MSKVTQSTTIAAPVGQVFAFVSEPQRAPTFLPGLNRISNLSAPQQQVGRTWEWEFNWLGLIFSGKSQCTQFSPASIYQFQTLTGADSTWTYRCEPRGAQTHLTLEVEYEAPQALLARVATAGILEKLNQHRAAEAIANIKTLLEP